MVNEIVTLMLRRMHEKITLSDGNGSKWNSFLGWLVMLLP